MTNTEAKESFIKKLIQAYGKDYLGEDNKKYYFVEGGVQVCVAVSCPKVPLSRPETPQPSNPAITQEERDNIDKLIASLGL